MTPLSPLSTGRHQAAVCALDGFVYVIGGAESWNCLNTVERYDPRNDTWTLIAPMNVARRGAGVAVHAGKTPTPFRIHNLSLELTPHTASVSISHIAATNVSISHIMLTLAQLLRRVPLVSRQPVCGGGLRWLPRPALRGGVRPRPQ